MLWFASGLGFGAVRVDDGVIQVQDIWGSRPKSHVLLGCVLCPWPGVKPTGRHAGQCTAFSVLFTRHKNAHERSFR